MQLRALLQCAVLMVWLAAGPVLAANDSTPLGDPVLEPPTLHSLGAYWIIRGDDNANATVELEYRKAGQDAAWKKGMPLFRVEKGAHLQPEPRYRPPNRTDIVQTFHSTLNVPEDAWLFAGSALLLEPDTAYELRLTLNDPDGGNAQHVLATRTAVEPQAAADAPVRHVVPGDGGGSGTEQDPFRGLAAAQEGAQPGDIMLLRAGSYGVLEITQSGQPGKPIIWRAAGDGQALFGGTADDVPPRAIDAVGATDVWFEGLTVRHATYGVVAHDAARIVVRRCDMADVEYGVAATRNTDDTVEGFFIMDNVMVGPSTWPRTRGIESARGVQVTGQGHVVAYNRIRGFADAIDTFPSVRCAAIDFHNNDISEQTDDGIEMDYSERNTRCFHNRITNVYQGITTQPVYGGPVYIFRNTMYNVGMSVFKMHNSPSGVLQMHNTTVKQGIPYVLYPAVPVRNSIQRNNLFVGTAGRAAFDITARMVDCDFDYDAIVGGPFDTFLKWNQERYATAEETRQNAPVYRNVLHIPDADIFASGAAVPDDLKKQYPADIDLRLKPGVAAIDAGEVIPGLNDDFQGQAPDLGAFELGAPLPHYGPRPLQ